MKNDPAVIGKIDADMMGVLRRLSDAVMAENDDKAAAFRPEIGKVAVAAEATAMLVRQTGSGLQFLLLEKIANL